MFGSGWDSLHKKWVVADCKLKNTNCHELTINYQRRWTQLTQLTQLTHLTRVTRFVTPGGVEIWWDKNEKILFNLTKLHLTVSKSLLKQEVF